MNKEVEKVLVPKFRFKQFSGEWEVKTLGVETTLGSGGTPSKQEESYWGGDIPWISASSMRGFKYFDSDLKITSAGLSNGSRLAEKGSLLLLVRGSMLFNKIPVGIATKDVAFNQDVKSIKTKPSTNNEFLLHWFLASENKLLNMVSGTGIGAGKLDTQDLLAMDLFIPTLPEQTKIAACLSSLEDLITAQAQKIEALKTHKKGLMQQLFPQEGETVPKLRFPEFMDSGEWEKTKLGQLGELVSGLTYSPDDVRDKGLLVLRSSNVQNGKISLEDNVYVSPDVKGANLSKPNDILICVRNGSKALIGKNALIPEGMPLCTHGAFMTVFRSKVAKFVFQLFQTNAYESQVAGDLGATINSINGRHLINYDFYVPTLLDEQQKIADCLSSLDELINAQVKKLDTLKLHKKGLMQGLFPSSNE
jgi:type I restriction enzyme S subunit